MVSNSSIDTFTGTHSGRRHVSTRVEPRQGQRGRERSSRPRKKFLRTWTREKRLTASEVNKLMDIHNSSGVERATAEFPPSERLAATLLGLIYGWGFLIIFNWIYVVGLHPYGL
jgi:hypothetical protein